MHKNMVLYIVSNKKVITTLPQTLTFFLTQIIFFLCNLGTPNSAAMGCSQPKLSRTGLRNILAFLKVELQHFLGGTQGLLPRCGARRLKRSNCSRRTKEQPC